MSWRPWFGLCSLHRWCANQTLCSSTECAKLTCSSESNSPIGEDPAPLEVPVPAVWACAEVSFAAAAPAEDVGVLDVDDDPTPPTASRRQATQARRQVDGILTSWCITLRPASS